jgi:hypothetical protein
MKPLARFAAMLTGLVLLLTTTVSWGQTPACHSPGCNPTVSDGNFNTAGGTGALNTLTSGTNNTAFGSGALVTTSSGDDNTAVGARALLININGSFNTGVGSRALFSNTFGGLNTAIGANALRVNTAGGGNTASGVNALFNNTAGGSNTASGFNALFSNTAGFTNTASGAFALVSNTTGNDNTASGHSALSENVTGFGNTAVGRNALFNSHGNKNIGIGYQAGETLTTGNNNIFIGNQGAGAESQTIRMGTAQTRTFIAGINVAGVSGATVVVDGNGQLGIPFSSARYKQDIVPMGTRSEKVLDLRPVTFAYKDDSKGVTHYGLVAEEVAAVYPELVTRTATGEVQTVKYQELIPMLLNELQRQRQDLARLQALVEQGQGSTASTCAATGQTAASSR